MVGEVIDHMIKTQPGAVDEMDRTHMTITLLEERKVRKLTPHRTTAGAKRSDEADSMTQETGWRKKEGKQEMNSIAASGMNLETAAAFSGTGRTIT